MRLLKPLTLLILCTLLYSCGPTVSTMKPTGDDLSKYDSFSYLPNAAIEMPTENFTTDQVNSMVIQQINDRMMDAGYNLERNNPDLLVLVSTKVDQETEVDTDPIYASYGYYNNPSLRVNPYYNNYYYRGYNNYNNIIGYETDTYQYKDGTLVVQLVDRKTKETVWKGVSSTSIYDTTSAMALTNLVNEIFEEYPLINN